MNLEHYILSLRGKLTGAEFDHHCYAESLEAIQRQAATLTAAFTALELISIAKVARELPPGDMAQREGGGLNGIQRRPPY